MAFVTEGDDAVRLEAVPDTIWAVSKTTATYKDVTLSYFARSNDKAYTYKKQADVKTLATVSGLRNNASTDSLSVSGKVITVTADALVESPNAKTKVTLGKKDEYTLALGTGVDALEYAAPTWLYNKGKATYTSAVATAGYTSSNDQKTLTYIPGTATQTYATLSGVKSASGISVDANNVISLTGDALNATKVTLGKNDPYTLALGDSSLAPAPETSETWTKNTSKATATLTVRLSPGYTLSDDARTLNYVSKSTTQTLALIGGINKNADITTFQAVDDGDTKKITLNAAQLSNKVTVSGVYKFDFASDFNDAAITGSAASDNIAVAGTGLTVTGGKGDDSIDLGTGGNNLFVYASGAGDDVIADFTATDKLKVSKGTPSVASDGSDVVVTVGTGSMTLTDAAGQNVSVLDKNNKATDYPTTAAADLLLSDNYSVDAAQLSSILKPAATAYTPYDFTASLDLINDKTTAPALTFADKK